MRSLLILDPGFQGLKNAVRGTLTVVLSFLLLSFLAKLWSQSPTLAFVGVMIGMMSSLGLNDATVSRQKGTLMWMAVPAGLGLSLSILLEPMPSWRLGCFLVVTFGAVSARRYGARATSLGLMAFMSYMAAMLFPISVEALPWVFGAALVSLLVHYLVRFLLLRERPARLLALYLEGFELQVHDLLERLARDWEGGVGEPRLVSGVRSRLARLNDLSLTIEQFLKAGTSHALKTESEKLYLTVFEREMNLRRLLVALQDWAEGRSEEDKKPVPELLRGLNRKRDLEALFSTIPVEAGAGLREAISRVQRDSSGPMLTGSSREKIVEELKEERKAQVISNSSFHGLHASTKQAIQATLATGLASMLGSELSAERWYWASITSFVVFAGASRGETITRAVFRVLGTFVGLVVGALIAFSLRGHSGLEWASIIFFVFLGILGARLAYGFFSAFAFTLMLAMLYNLMGTLTREILVLRLEETLLGALVGALVSFIVLPTSTGFTVRAATAKLLRTMGSLLEKLGTDDPEPSDRKEIVALLRLMDRDIVSLRAAAAPLLRRWWFWKGGDLGLALQDLTTIGAFLRHFAIGPVESGPEVSRLKSRCREIAKEISFLATRTEMNQEMPLNRERKQDAPDSKFLSRIDELLRDFAKRKI